MEISGTKPLKNGNETPLSQRSLAICFVIQDQPFME